MGVLWHKLTFETSSYFSRRYQSPITFQQISCQIREFPYLSCWRFQIKIPLFGDTTALVFNDPRFCTKVAYCSRIVAEMCLVLESDVTN